MTHQNECGSLIGCVSCIFKTSFRSFFCYNCFCNCLFICIDNGCIVANLTQQRLCDSYLLEFILILLERLNHLVILSTVHQVGRLDNQLFNSVLHGALQCLIHIVDALAVTSLNVVDNDLCGKCTADCPIRECILDGILDTLDIFHTAVVEGSTKADYQDLLVANLILIARIVQARVAGITTKIIWICVLAFYQLLLLVSQGIPCLFGCLALLIRVIGALLYIDVIDQLCHLICRFLIGIGALSCLGLCLRSRLRRGCLAGCTAAAGSKQYGHRNCRCTYNYFFVFSHVFLLV